MAYIVPNSNIVLIKNMNLDPSYTDTIYFDNIIQQSNFFYGRKFREYTAQYYTRVNEKKIRVEGKAEDLYDVNYMMFRNTAYGTKWFYAFVLRADYINDNTVELTFEIDVVQTWWAEAELEPCFVEREHSATDNVGDNILPEPVDLGEYKCSNLILPSAFKNMSVVVAYVDVASN